MTPASAPIHIHVLACLALGALVTFVIWCLCGAVAHEEQMAELESYEPQPKERP